jgi:hypothetical protein
MDPGLERFLESRSDEPRVQLNICAPESVRDVVASLVFFESDLASTPEVLLQGLGMVVRERGPYIRAAAEKVADDTAKIQRLQPLLDLLNFLEDYL